MLLFMLLELLTCLKLAYAQVLYGFGTKTLITFQDQALLFYKSIMNAVSFVLP